MPTLYVLQAKGTDIYKIGATRGAVPDRIKQLQVGCPFPLEVVCTHDAEDAFGLERGFHHYFHDKRLEGEWFRLSEVDVETIRRDCEEPPVPLPEEGEEDENEEVSHERGGAETSGRRHVQPYAFYLALPLVAVIGFIALDSSVGVVAREHLGNLWFIAFVVSLSLLVDSYRRRARERQHRNLSQRLAGTTTYAYMAEVVLRPGDVASMLRSHQRRALAGRLARGRLRGQTDRYQCVVELVAILEGRQVQNGSVRVALQRHFRRRGWTSWPATGEAWCAHFEEHPLG